MHKDATFKLRLPQEELAEWKQRAESQAMSLAAWIRYACNAEAAIPILVDNGANGGVPATETRRVDEGRASRRHGKTRNPQQSRSQPGAVIPPKECDTATHAAAGSPSIRHTAESNWRTCLCETCVQKRKAVA